MQKWFNINKTIDYRTTHKSSLDKNPASLFNKSAKECRNTEAISQHNKVNIQQSHSQYLAKCKGEMQTISTEIYKIRTPTLLLLFNLILEIVGQPHRGACL